VLQVAPFKPKLKPPGTNLLTLKCVEKLSTFAFKFHLRRYIVVGLGVIRVVFLKLHLIVKKRQRTMGRGLHSSTIRPTFCGICRVHEFPPVYQTGGHGEV